MKRVFLDANVLFTAAHNPNGKTAFLIELAVAGKFKLFTSTYAREEAERNICAKYPGCAVGLEHTLENITIIPVTSQSAGCPEILPAKDAPIFAAAVQCRSTHLLTGDTRHFGPLMNRPDLCKGMIVQTVAQFLDSLLQE
ncbi:MAG: PIN domain-containing protein [Desulfuromonadales bacterium]